MKIFMAALLFSPLVLGQVLLKDIGIIGLASHDMFSWDRDSQSNTENGRLDLSTIFDFQQGARWERGGDPKNGENAPVWSITMDLVDFFKKQRILTDYKTARLRTIEKFHLMILDSYQRISNLAVPQIALNQQVTNTEQAVLRAFHDLLPGTAKLYRGRLFPIKKFRLTDFKFAKLRLNQEELNQKIPYFDGQYAPEYESIKIPFRNIRINLKKIDAQFIEMFSPYRQDEMLAELALVGARIIDISQVSFIFHVKELFQKGLCSADNPWMAQSLPCI